MSLAFVFQLLLIGTEVGTGLWISDWTEETSENQTSIDIGVRLGVYATLGVCQGKGLILPAIIEFHDHATSREKRGTLGLG